jgi:hypothetical protein
VRRQLTVLLAGAMLLAACTHAGATPDAARTSSSSPSSTAPSTTAAALGRVDTFACQSFVATAGDAYGWLTQLQRQGNINSTLATPGYLQAYNLGGTAGIYTAQVESPPLRAALQTIETDGQKLRQTIDAGGGDVPASELVTALDNAAQICEQAGFVISWHPA